MQQGALSDYFVGVGAKVLQGTEVDPKISRGHELQGVSDFRAFLGSPSEKTKLEVNYVWLTDDDAPATFLSTGTWYDTRIGQKHREPEYRLYYPAAAEEIVYRPKAGDTLFLCMPKSGPLLALFCPHGSSIEQQLLWLFGLQLGDSDVITLIAFQGNDDRSLTLTRRYILELIGIDVIATEDEWIERLLRTFDSEFPSTRKFSDFARSAVTDVDAKGSPDNALLAWMDFEERLFMTLERHIVGERLQSGFLSAGKPDVDAFVKFSLSVQNRRKSRAGWAFGNHIEALLKEHKIMHVREATTEKRNGPDFLFPGQDQYHTWTEASNLTMLGAKTSCKDRWRQVLAEADRIGHKHLLTLEPGISIAQTDEMRKENLHLVIPHALHQTYRPEQRSELFSVADFLELLKSRQGAAFPTALNPVR